MSGTTIQPGVPRVRVARRLRAEWFYRVNRAGLYLLVLLYVPLVLSLVAGIAYGVYRLIAVCLTLLASRPLLVARALIFLIGFDLAAAFACLILLLALRPLLTTAADDLEYGNELRPDQHPDLFALIDRVCKRLNVRPPDTCLLDPFDGAGIGDLDLAASGGRVRKRVRTLMIGAGLVVHARIDEFATLLCHELAHAATGDTRMGRVATRFAISMATVLVNTEDDERSRVDALVYYALLGYFRLFELLHQIDSRYREFRADRIAAEICGPQNVRNLLIKTGSVAFLPKLRIAALWEEYAQNERPMTNLYEEHRRRWEQLPAHRRQEAENRMFMERTRWLDSHPCLADRIRNLGAVEAREWNVAQPATRLFHHWSALEEKLTAYLIQVGRAAFQAHLRRVGREISRLLGP